MAEFRNKQARKLQATLEVCNPKLCPLTDSLTGVKCRATSVAKNPGGKQGYQLKYTEDTLEQFPRQTLRIYQKYR